MRSMPRGENNGKQRPAHPHLVRQIGTVSAPMRLGAGPASRRPVCGGGRNAPVVIDYEPDGDDMSKWLKPLKVREYYLASHFDSGRMADKWLYLAVVRGAVRARSEGLVLGPEWIKQLSKMTFDDDNPFALPPDIEVSIEDVKKEI